MKKALRLNPSDTWKSPGFPLHQLVAEPEGKRVHISGQVAWDSERNVVGVNNAGAQTVFLLKAIAALLDKVGGKSSDIISVNVYYLNDEDYGAICDARKEFFSIEDGPVSTAVRVAGLVDPKLLVEISAIAVIPTERFTDEI